MQIYKIKNTRLKLESRIFHLHKIFYSAMESLRKNLFAYTLDDAPEDVRELYKDEFIQLYASSIKCFFNMHQIGIYIGKE